MMMKKLLSIVLSIAILPIVAVRADVLIWTMTGGTPQRDGLFTSMPQPPLSLLWQSDVGVELPSTSSSILTDGQKIFVAGNKSTNGQFVCLDWQTGKVDWRVDFGSKCISSPVISNNKISVAGVDGRIYGVGIDGKSAYSTRTQFQTASRADPMDTGSNLIFCLEDYGAGLVAVNPATNEINWDVTRSSSNSIRFNPCADSGRIFVCYNDDIVVAINETDHSIIWEKDLHEKISGGCMVVSGLLIIRTSKSLIALKTDNGQEAWNSPFGDPSTVYGNPATDGRLIFYTGNQYIYAKEVQTGNTLWSKMLGNAIPNSSTPSVGSGMVCVHDGSTCMILDCDTGEEKASFNIDSRTLVANQPLVLWDRIIFAGANSLTCWGLLGDPTPPPPNPPDPDPQPEPPKDPPVISTLKIDAPEKGYLDEIIEIKIDISDAKNWTSGEFTFVFDNTKLEFSGVKPGELLISQNTPLEIKAEPSVSGAKITASILKADGVTGNGTLVYIALKPKATGVHNLTIIGAKMKDSKGDTHEPNIEPDSFVVEERTEPPPPEPPPPEPEAEFSLTPENVDFGVITSPRSTTFRLVQRNGAKTRFVIRTSADFGLYSPGTGEIEANSGFDIQVTVNTNGLAPGAYEMVVSANVLDKTLKSTVKFVIPEKPVEPPSCIEIIPDRLDFGYIPRGREVSINFVIAFDTTEEISGIIEVDKQWLQVSPVVFKTRQKRIEGIATISASELPGGESFVGHMSIKTKGNVCRDVVVEAKVKSQPSILLEMDIGVSKARIASLEVPLDSPPFIRNNRTLVPIRFVSEAFGCKVQWEASSKKITITRFTDSITLWIGRKEAVVNGMEVALDVAPSLENSTTFVPIRFISEAFGAKVEWFADTRHIKITYTPPDDFTP